ncbi:MAG: acetate/propionate family kinase [Planctomycetota bacterium]
MNILVVNIGSTSFKYRLFDMTSESVMARGSVEGVGQTLSRSSLQVGSAPLHVTQGPCPDQASAIADCIAHLARHSLGFDAVGFKAVHGGPLGEAVRVTPEVLRIMEEFRDAAPAHNPPYIAAMRAFASQMPALPLVAAFETGFHRTVPEARRAYAIPQDWARRFGIERYGFHGASHRYVATRAAELLGRSDLRVISCHLGGSSSVSAIRNGQSLANSFGMTPQTGLPQNNRVGEFDPYALLVLRARTGLTVEEILGRMAREGGLLGLSGFSNDMAEIVTAAQSGNARAQLALDVFVESVRDHIGAYLILLGGLDVLAFTGGIGANSAEVRQRICRNLECVGIELDELRNERGGDEATLSKDASPVRVLALQTNEELIVARQTRDLLQNA